MSVPSPAARPAASRTTTYRHRVRYLEVDQQGVVFNMWYLGYFDEAMAAFLEEGGLSYRDLLASGFDVQLVHSTIDWRSSLHAGEMAEVEVRVVASGRTSFTLGFDVRCGPPNAAGGQKVDVAAGQTVYVVVATDGSGKRPIPDHVRAALGTGTT